LANAPPKIFGVDLCVPLKLKSAACRAIQARPAARGARVRPLAAARCESARAERCMASPTEVQPALATRPAEQTPPQTPPRRHQVPYRTSCCGVAIPPPDQPALRQRFWVRLFCGSLGAVFMLGSIFYYAYPDDMEFCWLDCPEVNGTATR